MQAIELKNDLISKITALTDNEAINEMYRWITTQKPPTISEPQAGFVPPHRKGALTEAFGIWADNTPDNDNIRTVLQNATTDLQSKGF
jgi:hypothetical protein